MKKKMIQQVIRKQWKSQLKVIGKIWLTLRCISFFLIPCPSFHWRRSLYASNWFNILFHSILHLCKCYRDSVILNKGRGWKLIVIWRRSIHIPESHECSWPIINSSRQIEKKYRYYIARKIPGTGIQFIDFFEAIHLFNCNKSIILAIRSRYWFLM